MTQDVQSVYGNSKQAVTGVIPPDLAEGRIREAWPTVLGVLPVTAALGQKLIRSIFLAPLGWLVMAPAFALKFAPFVCKRYTLTNRRLMVQRGLKPAPVEQAASADIDEVRVVPGSVDTFFFSGTLEVVGAGGKILMTLAGVPEPDGFRLAIVNAVKAWVPAKATGPFVPASKA